MFSDPQLWVAVAFVAFILVVFNPVRKIVIGNLDNKIKEIAKKINEAENLKNEAKVTLSEIKQRQSDVQKEITLLEEDSKNKITQTKAIAEKKLLDQIEKRKNLAEAKIIQLTRDANQEIQNHIAYTAIQATVEILEKKLDKKSKQNLINSSISELNTVLKN